MFYKKCDLCKVQFTPRKKWETMCYRCFHTNRITKLKDRKYKDANLIAYLQEQIYMLNHANQRWLDLYEELLDREILKDAIFLCHPDRNDSEERPDRVTK